jgi:hypothetical protein
MLKIPVFIHIPRSGGTYLKNKVKGFFRLYLNSFYKNNPFIYKDTGDARFIIYRNEKLIIKTISVKKNNKTILNVFCLDRYSKNETEYEDMSLDCFFERMKELDIFSMVLEANSIKSKFNILKKINRILCVDFSFYAAIRDPEERLVSLFYYLKSDTSSHEPTHQIFKSESFEDFVDSSEASESEGSLLSYEICHPDKISDENYENKVIPFLKKINLFKISNIDYMLKIAFLNRYNIKDDPSMYSDIFDSFNKRNKNISDDYIDKNFNLSTASKNKLKIINQFDRRIFELAF